MNRYLRESLFSVLLCGGVLLGIALMQPDIKIGNKQISFVSFEESKIQKQQHKAQLVADSITTKLTKDSLVIKKLSKTARIDTTFLLKHADSITRENRIVNSGPAEEKPLDLFFKALIEERESTVVRVAHYGDSQLEGDRVTSHIRKNLQAKFGGGGPGYLPLEDVANSATYVRSSQLISGLNVFNNRAKGSLCGLSGKVFRIQKTGQTLTDSNGITSTDTRIPGATFSFNDFRNFSHIRILAGKSTKPLKIKIAANSKDTSINTTLAAEATKDVNVLDLDVPQGLIRVNFQFVEGDEAIYAVMADAPDGIAVDNYAIRGHSGDGLFLLKDNLLSQQLSTTNTRLIIFQYGNNMVPYLESEKECKFYQTSFEKLFKKFRQAAPKASILVIGNGDMGRHKGGEALSYEYTSCLDEVMKNAATNTGCAFWSMLKAMGGQGAIATWSRKGLANLDGHLTNRGQKLISDLIFKALMLEYNDYAEKYVKESIN